MTNLLHLADRPGLVGFAVAWLLVALLAVVLMRRIVDLLDAGLELRNKWFRRRR